MVQVRQRHAVLLPLLLLTCVLVSTSGQGPQEQVCPPDDYSPKDGVCCNKCHPGSKLLEMCNVTGQRSKCIACPPRQFMDQRNVSPNCRPCRRCKAIKHEFQLSACSPEKDTVCQCEDGYYKFNIDLEAYECRKCSRCSSDEEERHTCSPLKNTVCDCKKNFYRDKKKKCQLCKTCSTECPELCTAETSPIGAADDPGKTFLVNLIAGIGAVALVLLVSLVLVTYLLTKRFTRSRVLTMTPSQPVDSSPETTTFLINQDETLCRVEGLNVLPEVTAVKRLSNLPDCVPLEIQTSELIYAVLDLVSVSQVKQLVRLLGVKDTEIEQAETDHRRCREASYQMLRIWAEAGAGPNQGRSGLLHGPLLEELLEKLRGMSLRGVAEELEIRFGIQ